MKLHSISFLTMSLFSALFLINAQKNSAVEKISFITLTRGAHQDVVITKDCVSIVKQGRGDEKEISIKTKITTEEWEKLLQTISNISLADITGFQSPSNKRAYDGAWHSTLTIATADKQSFGHSFDNEEPNEKLQALMAGVHGLVEKTEQHGRR